MAAALEEKNKVYALHIYDGGSHSLPLNRNRKIVDWFNQFGGCQLALSARLTGEIDV